MYVCMHVCTNVCAGNNLSGLAVQFATHLCITAATQSLSGVATFSAVMYHVDGLCTENCFSVFDEVN